jgi:probable HAF family extracellular repeat protein
MRAVLNVNCWARVWGLALCLLGIFHIPPAQAQQNPITDAAAQDSAPQSHPHKHHHYQLVDLGSTFGGPNSNFDPGSGNDFGPFVSVLNSSGTVAGFAETPVSDPFAPICFWNCLATHAFRAERNGVLTDLGTLPGGVNSAALWIDKSGLIAGLSENGETDPLYAGLPEVHAVLWQHGKITDLGTLPEGGYESEANAVNSSGQVVGAALNTIPDANSMQAGTFWLWGGIVLPYQYQTRAFLWDEQKGMQDLGTLPGGTDAQAILINERGQVIGYSYTGSTQSSMCFPLGTSFPLAISSFLWEKGKGMVDLGGFGGTCTGATDLNNQGQVVGTSFVTGDAFGRAFLWEHGSIHDLGGSLGGNNTGAFVMNDEGQAVGFATLPGEATYHATLWTEVGKMTDLGTLGKDPCSYATGINAGGQVVGASSDCNSIFRAFLWEDGSLFDLNALIPLGSALSVTQTYTINNRGEIAGEGRDGSGHDHALLLIPCDEDHADVEGCDYDLVEEAAATQQTPASVTQKQTTMAPSTPALNGPSIDVRTMFRGRLGINKFMGNAQQVALSGALAATSGPIATLSPTTLVFWPSAIGTTNGASSVMLKNTGTTSLTISRIAITGPNATDFTQTHTCGSSLAAGASCEVDVTFKATQIGNRTGMLSVSDNAHGSPQTVSLSGTGTDVVLSPAGLSFYCIFIPVGPGGSSCVCKTSGTATLTNVRSTTLKISGIAISAGSFSQTNSCGASVAAGGSCSVKVRWSPSTGGSRYDNGSVSISDNGRPSPQTLGLVGNKGCHR